MIRRMTGPLPDEALDALVLVLDEIRLGRSRSRSELVERTGLGRAIVAQRVGELIERGLVIEGDPGPSTGGRPPRQLSFRAGAGHVLVADLGATSIDVAMTTLDGRILGHHDEPARDRGRPGGRARAGRGAVRPAARDDPRRARARCGGSGSACRARSSSRPAGPISPPIMPGWDGYPIRERFAARYGAPVWVDNDVNVLALGEWRSGVAAGHDDVVVVKIGTGIGAGIISGGRLHRGAQGSAGDVGHIQVVDDPAVICRCGNIGCLEALRRRRGARPARRGGGARRPERRGCGRRSTSAGGSPRRTSRGRRRPAIPVAVAMLQEAGRLVGSMLASVVNFFNPSLIVIGGGVANSPDQLLASIRETVYRRSLPLATRDLLIQRSSLGGLAGVIGASSMVVDEVFSPRGDRPVAGRGRPDGADPGVGGAAPTAVPPRTRAHPSPPDRSRVTTRRTSVVPPAHR